MFEWSWKSRSTSGSRGSQRYWWFCLMDFHNFFSIYVLEVKESISDIPTELPCSGDLENPGQLPVKEVLIILSYKFLNFFSIYVFEVKESISDIHTELPCLGDLENPGQLPGREVLWGTGWLCGVVLWLFLRETEVKQRWARLVHAWVTVHDRSRFVAQWGVLMQPKNRYRMTPGVRHSGIVNWLIYFIYLLMILSYGFSQFLQYLCFRGQNIHFWHFYWATMFGWPQKSRSTSGSGGSDDSVLYIFEISSVIIFSRSRNPLLTFLLSYLVWVTSKIWVNFRFQSYSEVLMNVSYGFKQ